MPFKKIFSAAALMLVLSVPAQAGGVLDGGASTTIRLRAFVPIICRVRLSTAVGPMDDQGVAALGTANEFCNAPQGYRLLVQHPADLVGAALISNGERIPLSPSGETLLRQSPHADFRTTALAVDFGETPSAFQTISMRIEPNG